MRVLVVDDDPLIRVSVKAALEAPTSSPGAQPIRSVTLAESYEEAIARLDSQPFDLAFVDIRLGPTRPKGGVDLLKVLRSDAPPPLPS